MRSFLAASKLTAAWSGYTEPATHAVPNGSPLYDARSLCGVTELAVHTEGVDPVGFDIDSGWSCQRCVKKIRKADR